MTSPEERAATVPRVNGMPRFGLGTWQNEDPQQCTESVKTALESGYRHVDTAQVYGNEDAVGDGIATADVDREEVFLATKLWIRNLGYDDVLESTEQSLEKLGVDDVDLLYVHWPAGAYDPEETMAALDELYDRGLIKRVGVSNFEPHHVEAAMDELDAPLFANQVEMHPFLHQSELRAHADERNYEIVAYSPLARGGVFGHDVLAEIAGTHDVSEAQVSLAWLRAKDVTTIPKATSEAHILDNLASLDLELGDDEIARIDDIDTSERKVNPGFAPDAWD